MPIHYHSAATTPYCTISRATRVESAMIREDGAFALCGSRKRIRRAIWKERENAGRHAWRDAARHFRNTPEFIAKQQKGL